MLVAKFTEPFTVEISEQPVPELEYGQVLLKITRIGICASDIQMYHGKHKYMTFPVIPGHEAAAVIEEIADGVTSFKVGDRVTIQPQITCGKCYSCLIGRDNVCESLEVMGVHKNGFASEYVAIDSKYLISCPEQMSDDEIALVEPLAVGVGSVRRARNLEGANVAVVGAGTIGNLVAQSAKALGAGNVLITDISGEKLRFAEQTGIANCVNTKDLPLTKAIENVFSKRKADIIIDCAATGFSIASILSAARCSSQIIITGNFKEPVELELPVIQRQEIDILGHMMYVRSDFEEAVSLIAAKSVNLDGFITSRHALKDFENALIAIDKLSENVIKSIINV